MSIVTARIDRHSPGPFPQGNLHSYTFQNYHYVEALWNPVKRSTAKWEVPPEKL